MGLTATTTVEDACGGSFTNPYITLAAYGPGNGETDIHIFKNLSDNTYTIKTRLYYYKDRDARNAGKRFIQKVEKTYTTSNISQDIWSFLYTSYKTDLTNAGISSSDS
jgi:hypothetical protein